MMMLFLLTLMSISIVHVRRTTKSCRSNSAA